MHVCLIIQITQILYVKYNTINKNKIGSIIKNFNKIIESAEQKRVKNNIKGNENKEILIKHIFSLWSIIKY